MALFKSWFVDFDPVVAKAARKQPVGMSSATAAIFPGRFHESDLGPIPEGWSVVPLTDAIEVNPPRCLRQGEIAPYLDMQNMPTAGHRPLDWCDRAVGSGMRFQNGDVLMARITPCLENGKTVLVDFLREDQIGWGSTEYIVLRSKPPLPRAHAYFLARSDDFRGHAIANMTGSSGRQRVPANCLHGYQIVVPKPEVAVAFGKLVVPILHRVRRNDEENRTLADLRDVILPRLMSGELRVRQAEQGDGPGA
ncbi:MAG: restriction endonuclease subunit S [Planctomycetota bacterium]|nr:restriction endonuclease subunit S [Planctomycetota bacterium]